MLKYFKMNKSVKRIKACILIVAMSSLVSCAAQEKRIIAKEELIKQVTSDEFLHEFVKGLTNKPVNNRWNDCFDLTDDEFAEEIFPIYKECMKRGIERNEKKLPEYITVEETRILSEGVDQCAKVRFIVRNKDKFTFEKTPEAFERCLHGYESIIKKMQ